MNICKAITNTLNAIVPLMVQEQNFILKIFKIEYISTTIKKSTLTLNSDVRDEKDEKDEKVEAQAKEEDDEIMDNLNVAILSKVHGPIKDIRIKKKI